ncbi:CU044_2847 family protein [Bradyrhizobium centrosematis]|uniref:CU044_2847 family protein n=1 Tax=Bradyrhizobium centrosematis TaxID=1300039 RepID=UPI00389023E6
MDTDLPTEILKIKLPNGAIIYAEVQLLDREENIAGKEINLSDLKEKIAGIAEVVRDAIVDLKPKSASMEFGLEIGLETGSLTALLAKGTGKANLKVKLDW